MRLIDADALINSTDSESVHKYEIALAPTVDTTLNPFELFKLIGELSTKHGYENVKKTILSMFEIMDANRKEN